MKTQTKLIHSSLPDKETKSITAPIHLSTVFAMKNPSSTKGFQYGRVGNPTRKLLEKTLADLHGCAFAAVFSSGSAAISSLFATLAKDDHVLCHEEVYEGTQRILEKIFKKFGLCFEFINMSDPENIKKRVTKKTKIIFLESPTNPLLTILDIKNISKIAHQKNIMVVIDNTIATPIFQKPVGLGADVIIESLTKAINGHTDALGGVIATNNKRLFNEVKFIQHTLGAILSPFECFLILRGLKTLVIRMKTQQKNAEDAIKFLKQQRKASNIKHMGFLISFKFQGSQKEITNFLKSLRLITIGHSFGGVESLIQQPTTMMNLSSQQEKIISSNLLRLSIGLEDSSDIIDDLKQALKSIG